MNPVGKMQRTMNCTDVIDIRFHCALNRWVKFVIMGYNKWKWGQLIEEVLHNPGQNPDYKQI